MRLNCNIFSPLLFLYRRALLLLCFPLWSIELDEQLMFPLSLCNVTHHLPSGHMATSWPVPMLQWLWSSRQYFNAVASKHRAGMLAGLLQYTIKILNFFCFQKLNRMATPRGHSNSRQHMDSTRRMYADMFPGIPTALQRFYNWFTGVCGKTYHPSLSAAFTFTPNCTRNFTISVWPAHTALWRAVMPSSFGRLGSSTCHTNKKGERVTPTSRHINCHYFLGSRK